MTMTKYHAVMIDETGCEFGADCEAESREEARDIFRESYPESRIDQIESPQDTAAREHRIYMDALNGADYDEEGRPIYHYGSWDEEEDEE